MKGHLANTGKHAYQRDAEKPQCKSPQKYANEQSHWPEGMDSERFSGKASTMPINASAVKAGGPTAMNIPGLKFGEGKPISMRRWM
ncbi:hypothetical protein LTR28_002337 [Elasticomyces elasticus]|nr:hypothetical protein LTR28_002337 [Elasticomyces elasticus]